LSLGSYILLGKGAETSGGRDSESILADVYEAMIASIFLDQGYERARKLVLVNMDNQLNKFDNVILAPNDPKSQLQEYLQSKGSLYPVYRTVSSQGPDHDPIFTIHVLSDQGLLGTGQGKKKSDAERAAARDALKKIGICSLN
jgi:ribonuclease-3